MLATMLVGVVVATVTDRSVDASVRRRRRVPWELTLPVLAVVSYLRLDRVGGVRLVGADAVGGDLLAQAFPVLSLVAALAVVARPLVWTLERTRRRGRALPTALMIGLRRVGAEPATSAALALATALAIGSLIVSTSMTDSARRFLDDKAATYLGGDEVVSVAEVAALPDGLLGTVVGRVPMRSDGIGVDVIGIDPSTFTTGVRWRSDASDRSLDALLATIAAVPAPGRPLPAIVTGGKLGSDRLDGYDLVTLSIDPVATARWFPGEHAGSTLVVVNRDALVAAVPSIAEQVWLIDPPADSRARLSIAGFTVRGSQRAQDVFDVVSFLAVRWSYSALGAFGVVIGAVVIVSYLLVLDARRAARRMAVVLTRPMGLSRRADSVAMVTELVIPFVLGIGLAVAASVAVLSVAVPRFDTLRQLAPPARVVLNLGPLAAGSAVGFGSLLMIALLGVAGLRRVRPMEVMRSAA